MKNRFFIISIVVFFAFSLIFVMGCATGGRTQPRLNFSPGTYATASEGENGLVHVRTVFSRNRIESVTVISHNETPSWAQATIHRIPAEIVAHQSLAIDTVTGATITSLAIINAVADAARQAQGDLNALFAPLTPVKNADRTYATGVLVVGSGISGLSAAIEARKAGAMTLLIEKNGFFGGVTATSGGVIQGYRNPIMVAAGHHPNDTAAAFLQHMRDMSVGHYNLEMLTHIANTSRNTIEWLIGMGINFHPVPHISWGTSLTTGWQVHRAVQFNIPVQWLGPGATRVGDASHHLIMPMVEYAKRLGVIFMNEMRAMTLIQEGAEGSRVTGVNAVDRTGANVTITATSVILATGGYQANKDLLEAWTPLTVKAGFETRHTPQWGSWPVPWATGDGHIMGVKAGAGKVVGLNPNAALRGIRNHGIWVTPSGNRFEDESFDYWPAGTGRLFSLGYHYHWNVWGSNTNPAAAVPGAISANSIAALAQLMYPGNATFARALEATISAYNNTITTRGFTALPEHRPQFSHNGATRHQPVNGPNFFATRTGGFAYPTSWPTSRGGLKINIDGQVLTAANAVIPGLFAAGEVANGDILPLQYGGSGMALAVYANMARRAGVVAAGGTWVPVP